MERGCDLRNNNSFPNVYKSNSQYEWSSVGPCLAKAARVSGGTILELVHRILVTQDSLYGVGIVRPPGHHCGVNKSSGNGILNNVAIAAKWISKYLNLKVFILDWDIHYSGGTTEILRNGKPLTESANLFEDIDPNIYFADVFGSRGQEIKEYAKSLGREWKPIELSQNACFINVNKIKTDLNKNYVIGDEVYLENVWTEIQYQLNVFCPDVLLISCGFDGAFGEDEGFCLTPTGYYRLTKKCVNFMKDKPIIIALEGGYKPDIMAECMCKVVTALIEKTTESTTFD